MSLPRNYSSSMPVKPPKKVWDDEEEAKYREWLKNQKGGEGRAEFSEYRKEMDYRERLREDTKRRGSDSNHKVDWDNKEELQLQEKYRKEARRGSGSSGRQRGTPATLP